MMLRRYCVAMYSYFYICLHVLEYLPYIKFHILFERYGEMSALKSDYPFKTNC